MAIDPTIRDQAYQFFIEEAPELLQILETELLTLSRDYSTAKVHNLMRAAHSIKGGAASVGLETIASIAHRLENIFKALYGDALEITTELETNLLQAYDCLRLPLMEQIQTGTFNGEQALANADPVLTQLEERCGDALNQESYIPSSSDLGIDMVASIVEVDVAQGLQHLVSVLAQPEQHEVVGEVRAQMDIFAGFSELLNLPEFGAITAAVQQAILINPSRVLEMLPVALADFEQCRHSILAGDRTANGLPSPELVAFTRLEAAPSVSPLVASQTNFAENLTEAAFTEEDVDLLDTAIPLLENLFGNPLLQTELTESEILIPDQLPVETQSWERDSDAQINNHDTSTLESENELEPTLVDLDSERSEFISSDVIDVEWIDEIASLTNEQRSHQASDDHHAQHALILADRVSSPDANLAVPSASASSHPSRPSDQTRYSQSSKTSPASLTIRVDSERLEKMNNLVGELMINRDGLSLQNEQLQGVLRVLLNRFGRFQRLLNEFRELSDQMLTASERPRAETIAFNNSQLDREMRPNSVQASYQLTTPDTALIEFDPLEMDRYGGLHFQMQEMLEDLVQLEESVEDITLYARQSNQLLDQQRQTLTYLQNELKWARMLPLGEVLNRFPRVLRDLSATYHKPVQLKLVGTEILVDKAILEKLYDPLLHLLRNAFDHGIEPPAVRQQRGKSEQGRIEIRAYHKGNQTIIEMWDDGQGLNLDRIRGRAYELGWLTAEQLLMTPPAQLFELIFEPGFSTADRVSELSGRGVGLDVVRSQVAAIKGNVTVSSLPQQGTTFTLQLPLTLTIARLIIGLIGSTAVALPADSIEEIFTPAANQIKQSGLQRFVYWHDQIIPTYRLGDLLEYACPLPEIQPSKALMTVASPKDWASPMLILRQDDQLFALEVERLVNEQELVVKSFGAAIAPPAYTYGCTILGDGRLVPVIDAVALLALHREKPRSVLALPAGQSAINPPAPVAKTIQAPTILVVDDAVTLRRTLALSLEREGFRILQARDGWEAIDQLPQGTSVKLVICDVEMPNMNGFEFLSYRRQHDHLAQIPVVMLTSRSNDKHRWLAMQLGATDYFTKPYLEQEFLTRLKAILETTSNSSSV